MRVADDLKPHNRETIRRILEFYKTERKCCAIQATGTGKTFLILRLLEILNDEGKMAVIFAPNNEIIRQTKKRMKKFGLNNALFHTYQKLARMTEEEICAIKADLIICDELHRTGAKTWGQKFELLVASHPDSKVFGVTATPLRCADGRDMAEEYFDGNKACDISLAEALVREIIPVMPLYVSALYTFEEEYQKMSDKIDKANNSNEEKVELQKELLAAKQQLEKANGVPEIIKKYVTNYNGKYLVFCKDKKHLYAMKDVVIGWFREAGYDGRIFEYPYYSNSNSVRKNLKNFEDNKEEGLKLLFIIDKLNEGLHLDEVHGCILLRTTVSNIIYYQQIGRAIDAGSNEQRVILDLVSNFNSLKSFNLKKELEEKVRERKSRKFLDCSDEFELDKFDVVDCVQECVDVFNQIDEQLKDVWWKKYDEYVDIINNGVELSGKTRMYFKGWIGGIKRDFEEGLLSKDKVKALKDIGFDFSKRYVSYNWSDYYKALKLYLSENNDVDINSIYRDIVFEKYKIGEWIHRQRVAYSLQKLTLNQINQLEKMGLFWNLNNDIFADNLSKLEIFIKENNQYPTKKSNYSLFNFVSDLRKNYKNGRLSDDKVKALNNMGFIWDKLEYEWNKKYNLCKEYKKMNGKLPIATTIYKNENIGYWIGTQKKTISEGKICENRIKLLRDLGIEVEKYKVA